MRLNRRKIDIALARIKKTPRDAGVPCSTLYKARRGISILPKTAGIIAEALGVDVTELIEDGGNERD